MFKILQHVYFCPRALQAFVGAYFGEGTGPVFLENLGCSGNEKHLDSCSASGLFSTSCRHSHDVGVACLSKYILCLISVEF